MFSSLFTEYSKSFFLFSIQYGAAVAASKGLMDTQPPILLSLHHKSSAESTPVEPLHLLAGGLARNIVCNSGIVLQYGLTVAFVVQIGRYVAIGCLRKILGDTEELS